MRSIHHPIIALRIIELSRSSRQYTLIFSFAIFFFLTLVLASCGILTEKEEVAPSESPLPPARADLQIPGLVELVDENLTAPHMSAEPSQLEIGAETYYQICLACHGDWGQGLTDEWRETWGEDQNCWQSKCHASNHPVEGFELPKTIPPVLGQGSLARYRTGEELQANISLTMPWWNPGSLTEEQSWAVTAYLMNKRGELSPNLPLERGTASVIRLHQPAEQVVDYRPWTVLTIIVLSVAAIVLKREDRGMS